VFLLKNVLVLVIFVSTSNMRHNTQFVLQQLSWKNVRTGRYSKSESLFIEQFCLKLADDLAVLLVEIHKCDLVFKHVPKPLMDVRKKDHLKQNLHIIIFQQSEW
jgi:hypothetical protein